MYAIRFPRTKLSTKLCADDKTEYKTLKGALQDKSAHWSAVENSGKFGKWNLGSVERASTHFPNFENANHTVQQNGQ
jgi:hypothetical protein